MMSGKDEKFAAQKIREQYVEKESTELDALYRLDAKVKRAPTVASYIVGSIGAVVMGAGMSLVMTEIGATLGLAAAMPIGIAVGVIGLGIAVANYPIYRRVLAARRKKYAAEILSQSEKVLNG